LPVPSKITKGIPHPYERALIDFSIRHTPGADKPPRAHTRAHAARPDCVAVFCVFAVGVARSFAWFMCVSMGGVACVRACVAACRRFRGGCARARRRGRRQTPSCDGMSPQNNRHVGEGAYCQPEDYLTASERAATLGI
jgi:hypothetical protein